MDPTRKGRSKPTAFIAAAASNTKGNPIHRFPIITGPPLTIEDISNHFSKLYENHNVLTAAPLKGSNGVPQSRDVDTRLQPKAISFSTAVDASSESLIKLNRQRSVGEKGKGSLRSSSDMYYIQKAYKSKMTDEDKTFVKKMESKKKESNDEGDELKRPSVSITMNSAGRRSSFCGSTTELANFFSCSGVKIVSADMPPFMQVHAVDSARKAYDSLEKFTSKALALTLKKEFDGVYGPAWHCIVGTNFGSFVTHSVGGFLYFSMDHKFHILFFKTTVQRAD